MEFNGGGVSAEAPGHISRAQPDRAAVQANDGAGLFIHIKSLFCF